MGKIGIHVQAFTPGCAEWVADANPPILKTMDASLDPLKYILDRSPETKIVVFRKYFEDHWQSFYMAGGQGDVLADAVVNMFRASIDECLRRGVDVYVEGLNEPPWDPWDSAPDKQARLYVAFAERCAQLGVKPAVLSMSVGNPPGSFDERRWIWGKLYPALYAAKAAGGCLARHLYGAKRMWEPDPKYYALRYRDDRTFWPADLQDLPEIVSECGIDWGVLGGFDPPRGWRSSGSASQYVEDLTWFGDEIAKDAYVLGSTIFSAGVV
jgi:hypothetical protein